MADPKVEGAGSTGAILRNLKANFFPALRDLSLMTALIAIVSGVIGTIVVLFGKPIYLWILWLWAHYL